MLFRNTVDLEETTIEQFSLEGRLTIGRGRGHQLQIDLEQTVRPAAGGHFHAEFDLG